MGAKLEAIPLATASVTVKPCGQKRGCPSWIGTDQARSLPSDCSASWRATLRTRRRPSVSGIEDQRRTRVSRSPASPSAGARRNASTGTLSSRASCFSVAMVRAERSVMAMLSNAWIIAAVPTAYKIQTVRRCRPIIGLSRRGQTYLMNAALKAACPQHLVRPKRRLKRRACLAPQGPGCVDPVRPPKGPVARWDRSHARHTGPPNRPAGRVTLRRSIRRRSARLQRQASELEDAHHHHLPLRKRADPRATL